jgi:hypothetical protein
MANLNAEQLRRLARLGATSRLEQIRVEEAAIRAEFPELFGRGGRRDGATRESAPAPVAKIRRRRRSAMSAAARKEVSARMKKYWAERRKAKGAK